MLSQLLVAVRQPFRGKVWRIGVIAGLLYAFLLVAAACVTEREPSGPPLLPETFQGARVPASTLMAYGFFTAPIFEVEINEEGEDPRKETWILPLTINGEVLRLEETITFHRGSFWIESNSENQGWQQANVLNLPAIADAEDIENKLQSAEDFWFQRRENRLYTVVGEGAGAVALRDDISSDHWVLFEDKYPEAWRVMQRLPGDPPSRVIATGFFRNDADIYSKAADITQFPSLVELGETLRSTKAEQVIFGMYGEQPVTLGSSIPLDALVESRTSILLIARAGISALNLRDVLNKAIKKSGLEKMTLSGETVYYTSRDDLHLMVGNLGTVIYVSLATDKDAAGALLISALKAK